MAPLVSVFLLSHNKRQFAVQAVSSVLAQDFADFELWVIENSTDGETRARLAPLLGDPRVICEEVGLTPEERAGCYVPAMLLNRYYPKANGELIFYLSDDDLWEPSCVRRCVEVLADPEKHVAWFGMRIAEDYGNGPVVCGGIPAFQVAGKGTPMLAVDCRIDGGQVAHRKSCLDVLEQPWFPETAEAQHARHADGLFLQKLAFWYTFWPIGEDLLTHRRTPLSVWDNV